MRLVELEAGDVLVLRVPYAIPIANTATIQKMFDDTFGVGFKLLILQQGIDLDVVRDKLAKEAK